MYLADMAISTQPRVLGLLQIVFVSKLHESMSLYLCEKNYQCTSELVLQYTIH